MAAPLNVIPTRLQRYASDQPAPHCSVAQVNTALLGLTGLLTQRFGDPDGSLTTFNAALASTFIPEATSRAVAEMRQPLDWCRTIYFFDGPAGDSLSLPYRYIYDVNLCYLRVIPSLPFYAFQRIRNVDGSAFSQILGVEPLPPPMSTPPFANIPAYASSLIWTGMEDADLLVDTRARELRIPPRVLIASAGLPISQFQFLRGTMNVEVHFRFGYPPTAYTDGSPLQFDIAHPDANGNFPLLDPKPGTSGAAALHVDWSSGMPTAVSMRVARLAAIAIKRELMEAVAQGVSSMSVEGTSESYGDLSARRLNDEEATILKELSTFGITTII